MFKRQYDDSSGQRKRPRSGYDASHDGRSLISMQDCDSRLRDFAQRRKQRGFVADEAFARVLADVLISLDRHIHDNEGSNYIEWEGSQGRDASKSIAFHLYNLGTLARDIKGGVKSSLVEFISIRLGRSQSLNSKSISNATYGLGLLARAGKIHGRLDTRAANSLLSKLCLLRDVGPQELSNTLYGLGLLGQAGFLDGQVDSRFVQALLDMLHALRNAKAQELSNTLYGLGLLAQAGFLNGQVDSRSVQALLDQLHALRDATAQNISNTFYGLGLLAQAGLLNGQVDSRSVQALFDQLHALRDATAQNISNTLYALGLVAQAGLLNGQVDSRSVQALLDQLHALRDVDAQGISNTFYGLGLLAQAGLLNGQVDSRSVQALLDQLHALRDVKAQDISNTLYGLGLLAQAGLLNGQVDSRSVQALLDQLHALRDVDAQNISNTFYGLGLLAQAGLLNGQVDSHSVQALLDQLHALRDATAQNISNTFYGLGLLAQAGLLNGQVDSRPVQGLLDQLHALRDATAQSISNTLYGLGLLVAAQRLKTSPACIAVVLRLIPAVLRLGVNTKDAEQLLLGLSELVPGREVEGEQLRALFTHALDRSYLHPANAAQLIHYLVVFRAHHRALTDVFTQISSSINIPLSRFPAALQAQLKDDLSVLVDVPQWQSVLSTRLGLPQRLARAELAQRAMVTRDPRLLQSAPRPAVTRPVVEQSLPRPSVRTEKSASWVATCQGNAVFAAIASKDMEKLRRLFGMLKAKSAEQVLTAGFHSRGAHHGTHGTDAHTIALPTASAQVDVDNIATANALTIKFLKETPGLELQELIAHSTFDYFELMLRACSHHTRYQLAIDNALHNILLHLPITELCPMVKSLINQGLYRDHQALLALVDALSIRLFKHDALPVHHRDLIVQRRNLFDRAIEHHKKANHHRVVPRLEAALSQLESPDACLLDDEAPTERAKPSSDAPRLALARQMMPAQASVVDSRSTLFARSEPRAIAAQGLSVSLDYEYTAEDIEAILRARLHRYQDELVILAAANEGAAQANRVLDVLINYLEHAGIASLLGKKVVLPINLGRHWVGVILEVDERRNVTMSYFNSSRNIATDNALKDDIAQQLRQVVVHGQPVFRQIDKRICLREMQQVDGTSCGAFLIENFYCSIKNQWWPVGPAADTSSLTKSIRLRHLDALKDRRADYYPGFLARQQEAGPALEGTDALVRVG